MDTTKEIAAIENVLAEYGESINASNVSKTLALFAQGGTLMPNGAPLAKGQEQLKEAYGNLYKVFQLNVGYFTDEVIVNNDYAYARTNSKGKTLIRATEQTILVDNKELFVLQKENGQWRIACYIFNNNKTK